MKTIAKRLFEKYDTANADDLNQLFLPSNAWKEAEKMCTDKDQDWNQGTTTYIFGDSSALCAKESSWEVTT